MLGIVKCKKRDSKGNPVGQLNPHQTPSARRHQKVNSNFSDGSIDSLTANAIAESLEWKRGSKVTLFCLGLYIIAKMVMQF
jgi:hypothetical protein